jgi:hypothetical protein
MQLHWRLIDEATFETVKDEQYFWIRSTGAVDQVIARADVMDWDSDPDWQIRFYVGDFPYSRRELTHFAGPIPEPIDPSGE